MSSAAEILVIILAVVLSVFLIVSIILIIYLIRLSAEIRKIAASAQKTVDSIASSVSGVSRILSPVFVADVVTKFIKRFTGADKKKGSK